MARIAGVNIPQNKIVLVALTYIHGIGDKYSNDICAKLSISKNKRVNGLTEIALTKLDILNGFKKLPICIEYDINGKRIKEMPASLSQFRHAKPIYKTLPGWEELPNNVWDKGFDALPETLKNYISYIEEQVECPVTIVSVGPQRHETIIR